MTNDVHQYLGICKNEALKEYYYYTFDNKLISHPYNDIINETTAHENIIKSYKKYLIETKQCITKLDLKCFVTTTFGRTFPIYANNYEIKYFDYSFIITDPTLINVIHVKYLTGCGDEIINKYNNKILYHFDNKCNNVDRYLRLSDVINLINRQNIQSDLHYLNELYYHLINN